MLDELLTNHQLFRRFLQDKLNSIHASVVSDIDSENIKKYSSVLVPLSVIGNSEIAIMLNKRSRSVPQPGDLCFPGGTLKMPVDNLLGFLAFLLQYSFLKTSPNKFLVSTLLATAIRESWEEIRLNPFSMKLLGILPPQKLSMFSKIIIAFVCWVDKARTLKPNNEVEKILWIPLNNFLERDNYGIFRLYGFPKESYRDFPCFLFQDGVSTEILWGATYRIVMGFLKDILRLNIPYVDIHGNGKWPIVPGLYDPGYLTGYERKKQ